MHSLGCVADITMLALNVIKPRCTFINLRLLFANLLECGVVWSEEVLK